MDIASYFPLWSEGRKGPAIHPGEGANWPEAATKQHQGGDPAGKVQLSVRRPNKVEGRDDDAFVATTVRFEFEDGEELIARGVLPYDEVEGARSGRLVIQGRADDPDVDPGLVIRLKVTGPKRWDVEGGG